MMYSEEDIKRAVEAARQVVVINFNNNQGTVIAALLPDQFYALVKHHALRLADLSMYRQYVAKECYGSGCSYPCNTCDGEYGKHSNKDQFAGEHGESLCNGKMRCICGGA
jgi:hypothetical protein